MKAKIFILIYLILIGLFGYFVYPIFMNRYSNEDKNNPVLNSNLVEKDQKLSNESELKSNEKNIPDSSTVPDDILIDINTEDCEDNCDQFEDAEEKKYCQEYCGLNSQSPNSNDNCESLLDLEKDYCYKNQAIIKKDFNLCKKISDKKIMESCKTRLTEDLINDSNPVD